MNQKPTSKKVKCPACGRQQEDRGKRSTCIRCGYQPLPSYDYPKHSAWHHATIANHGKPKLTCLK